VRYLAFDEWALEPGVTSLLADGCGLGDDDAVLLALALRHNDQLETLSLRDNSIFERGERALSLCLT